MFARACQTTSTNKPADVLLEEVGEMRKVLVGKLTSIYGSSTGEADAVAFSIWSSGDETEAVAAALAPKLEKAREGVERLLYEVVTLEVGTPTVL